MTKKRRSFTTEFKLEAAQLVTQQGYSAAEASRSLGVSDVLLGRWVRQLKKEHGHHAQEQSADTGAATNQGARGQN